MPTSLETMLMRARLSCVLVPLFLIAILCAPNFAFCQSVARSQESTTFAYHSTVSEVRLVFFATDEHGHTVEELQKDDFAVVDDERVIRDFRSFTRSALIKLDVIVLIDASESVLPQLHQEITEVLQLNSRWPWTPEGKISILSFSGLESHLICSGNCRSAFVTARVASLPSGGATPLFDTLEIAADLLIQHRRPDVWPVIILFSDGGDTISKSSFDEALEKTLASGAQVYAVDVGNRGQRSNGTATLQRLAADSGGRLVPIGEGALRILSDVMDDLHSARVVTYALPESSSNFHSIRIFPTHNLNLQFRSRSGYYHQTGSAHQEDAP
jgi:VWFA-related protein